jgi:hypothetical protein
MPETSTLEFRWASRAAGGGKTARRYLDYIVNGRPLAELLSLQRFDLIGGLGWGALREQKRTIDRLLLHDAPDLPSGRYMLFICPECGDIGCGAITAAIEKSAEHFIWRDFGYENDSNQVTPRLEEFAAIGPFYFDVAAYLQAFETARCKLKSPNHALQPTATRCAARGG